MNFRAGNCRFIRFETRFFLVKAQYRQHLKQIQSMFQHKQINLEYSSLWQITNKIMNQQELDALIPTFNTPNEQISKKIKAKKEAFLIKHQLFTIIYQKKGGKNFDEITHNIKIFQYSFGFDIIPTEASRTFNYILRGNVMIFVKKNQQPNSVPILYKKIGPGQYFGQKSIYAGNKLHSVKSVGKCYVLQLPLQNFYKAFSGHFTYHELKDRVNFLQKLWIFNKVRKHDCQRIILTSKVLNYSKNTIVFRQKQSPQFLYVILEGELTLFHENSDKSNGQRKKKYSPFMILTQGQICGVEQMYKDQVFEYVGICTSANTQLLSVSKKLFSEILADKILDDKFVSINSLIKKQYIKKKQKGRLVQSVQKIHSESAQPKKLSLRAKQNRKYPNRIYTQQSLTDNSAFNIQNCKVTKQNLLKNRKTRQIIQSNRKSLQKNMHSQMRISSYTNSSFTIDKQLLLGYLVRKQKKQKIAQKNQIHFRSTQFPLVKEFEVQYSQAIKNQKRKLKRSRRHTSSVPNIS